MSQIIKNSWTSEPPRIYAISRPLPDAPYLFLSGGGTSTGSLENYIKDLERDVQNQDGQYFAYVMKSWGGEKDEADTFFLKCWEVYTSTDSCYEALVILYYAPINEYLCLKKHKGEEAAQEYLDEIKKREVAIASLTDVLS